MEIDSSSYLSEYKSLYLWHTVQLLLGEIQFFWWVPLAGCIGANMRHTQAVSLGNEQVNNQNQVSQFLSNIQSSPETMYSCSLFVSFASMDSSNHGSKIHQEMFLFWMSTNFSCHFLKVQYSNDLHGIYIVFGIISDLEGI
jgi:hypothetical protein